MSFLKYIAIASVSMAALALIYQSAYGMYEDQIEVCNFKQVCQVVNTDDYMDRQQSSKLWNNFNQDLDTYDRDTVKVTQNQLDYNEDIAEGETN